jgi:uncharacterized protein YkwD
MLERNRRDWIRRGAPVLIALLVAVAAAAAGAAPSGPPVAAAVCPHQDERDAAPAVQERAMLCLVNRARRSRGLAPLRAASVLSRAARHKSADILRCGEFSHEACGRAFTYWMQRFGYLQGCANAGENIAWGTGPLGSARLIFGAWMRSSGHRENILGEFEEIGIGLRTGELEGSSRARVWTQDFGSRC